MWLCIVVQLLQLNHYRRCRFTTGIWLSFISLILQVDVFGPKAGFLFTVAAVADSGHSAVINNYELDPEYWHNVAEEALKTSLERKLNMNVAKNVVFFLGDGMSLSTIMASRVYKGQKRGKKPGEETSLHFEKFPNVGLLKTYNVDRQVPDSAGTSTAFLCGVKANYHTLGVSAKVHEGDCNAVQGNEVESILSWAQAAGKSTGFVTTTRVTHATPAGLYAHTANRNWEADVHLSDDAAGICKDIGRQLVEDLPGRNIQVILGGGRKIFLPVDVMDEEANVSGLRNDGRNLVEFWKKDKQRRGAAYQYVTNLKEFRALDPNKVDFLLGLFEYDHMQYEVDRNTTDLGEPSLAEMTQMAIKILHKNPRGFYLLVEGGRIDHAHHSNNAMRSFEETIAMDDAVQMAMNLTNLRDTLVIVTADHSHVMTVNGYPKRGNPILGTADISDLDNLPYTTIMYTNGPGFISPRPNVSQVNTNNKDYLQLSAVPLKDETHAGEDVAIYATGPMAHLFHGVNEQHYVPHVIGYAACIGRNKAHCAHTHHAAFIGGQMPDSAPSHQHGMYRVILSTAVMIALVLGN